MSETTNRERPVLFSGPMVNAIRAGRKTVTRRVVKQVPSYSHLEWHNGPSKGQPRSIMDWGLSDCYTTDGRHWLDIQTHVDDNSHDEIFCPYGKPGDRLWVRETFLYREAGKHVIYRADFDPPEAAGFGAMYGGWKPSIFMPRWASRLTLEVVSVRVERLAEITENDARLEGVLDGGCLSCGRNEPCNCENPKPDARESFAYLWDKINGKSHPWNSNPWVWRVEFRKVEAANAKA